MKHLHGLKYEDIDLTYGNDIMSYDPRDLLDARDSYRILRRAT